MNSNCIVYQPYHSYSYFFLFIIAIGTSLLVVIGYSLSNPGLYLIILLLLAILCVTLAKFLYDTSKSTIFFETEGLRIIDTRTTIHTYFRWTDIAYAYYARSRRGHLFVVLSKEELFQSKIKQYVNKGANSSKICVEEVVVINMDPLQDFIQLKEFLNCKVLHIHEI